MTAAAVLQRPDQASTTRATRSPTPLTCSCAWLDGRFAVCPESELAIRTIPPRSFLPDPLEVARCL